MRSPGGVPERPKGTGCKPVGSAYGGSNPPAPTLFWGNAVPAGCETDPVTASPLESMQVDEVLEHVNVPSYHIDSAGVIRWLNRAARKIVGDVQGRQFTSVVAPEATRRARELFARKIVGGTEVTDAPVVVLGADGRRIAAEISSVPIYHGDHVVGVFGQVSDLIEEPHEHPDLHLTPRQAEVLELLERGRTTKEIAAELHLSVETVRNHVKKLLRAVGAHSRLEAVAIANSAA